MNFSRLTLPLLALSASIAGAQQPAASPPPAAVLPEVGTMAPDFEFTPVTKDGGIGKPTKLSALKGQTVVVWFFFKARTRG